jgi:hypothetical protein
MTNERTHSSVNREEEKRASITVMTKLTGRVQKNKVKREESRKEQKSKKGKKVDERKEIVVDMKELRT